MSKSRSRRICLFGLALMLVGVFPGIARAETRSFFDTTPLFPSGGAGTSGPANVYPSSIVVSGVTGTVTKATVTVFGLASSSPDDVDMAITGPNGQAVMLMSDACGLNPSTIDGNTWTFDDAAPTFISNNGPCLSSQEASFLPSNYVGAAPEPDNLSPGGPPPPYLNAMSFFNGASPSGSWNLFVLDDNAGGFVGFDIGGWGLTLEFDPPPTPAAVPQPTGQRAAALKKCKKKRGAARRKCKRKANRLPL